MPLLTEVVPLCDTADMGVCGGVLKGRVWGWDEFVAVTSGTAPKVGVGLLTTFAVDCWVEDCVATEHAEFERTGLAGGGWLTLDETVVVVVAWLGLTGETA